jgi:hypothetical protein
LLKRTPFEFPPAHEVRLRMRGTSPSSAWTIRWTLWRETLSPLLQAEDEPGVGEFGQMLTDSFVVQPVVLG